MANELESKQYVQNQCVLNNFTWLLLGGAILEAAGYFAFPFLALRLRDHFKLSLEQVGIIISTAIWLRPLVSILGGWLSERLHGKWLLSLACLPEAICFFLLALTVSPVAAIAGVILGNIGFSIWAPNLFSIATVVGPKSSEILRLSKLNEFINVGAAFGCVAGGIFATVDPGLVFMIAGLLYLGIIPILFPILAAMPTSNEKQQTQLSFGFPITKVITSQGVLIRTAVVTLAFWASYGQFNSFFGVYAKDWLKNNIETGLAFAAVAVGVALFSALLSKSKKAQNELNGWSFFSLSGLVIGWVLLTTLPGLTSVGVFVFFLALSEAMLSVYLANKWHESFSKASSLAQGWNFALRSIGMGFGTLLGGFLYVSPEQGRNLISWLLINIVLIVVVMLSQHQNTQSYHEGLF